MTDTNKKVSLSHQTFHDFTTGISCIMIEKYAAPYQTLETMGNKWRNEIPYKSDIEKELITYSRTFIRTLPSGWSCSTDLWFLHRFTKDMADYLSAYTMRAPNVESRKDALRAMHAKLFAEFDYIIHLRRAQESKRAYRASRDADKHKKKAIAKKRAENAYNKSISRQVQGIFEMAKHLRGCR